MITFLGTHSNIIEFSTKSEGEVRTAVPTTYALDINPMKDCLLLTRDFSYEASLVMSLFTDFFMTALYILNNSSRLTIAVD